MKTLKIINNNDTFKVDETGTLIPFHVFENDYRKSFTKDDQVEFKIKNKTGFVLSATGMTTEGGSIVNLKTADLKELTPDTYACELWVTNSDGVNIYPDEGFVKFTINENCLKVNGEILPEISLSDFTKQFDDYVQAVKQGPQGEPGPVGPQGEPGSKGIDGKDGVSASISVGQVTTLDTNATATVTNSGSDTNAILNFGIPKGPKGEQGNPGKQGPQGPQGIQGIQGPNGKAGTITVGTISTSDDETGEVTNSGTKNDAILNFVLPIDKTASEKADKASTVAYSVLDQSNKNTVDLMAIQSALTALQSMLSPQDLPDTNLNNVRTPKVYNVKGSNVTNAPVNNYWGLLIVLAIDTKSNGLQILVDTNSNRLYFRCWHMSGGSIVWKNWKSSYYYG